MAAILSSSNSLPECIVLVDGHEWHSQVRHEQGGFDCIQNHVLNDKLCFVLGLAFINKFILI